MLSDFASTDVDDDDVEFREVDDELDKCIAEGLVDYGRNEKDGVGYSFVHDQIQNAALKLLPENNLPALQLQLGQIILQDEESECFDKYGVPLVGIGLVQSWVKMSSQRKGIWINGQG
jgi:hypothetical protein